MLELALVENLQREDINPIDAAEAYSRLVREFSMTQEQVAERVGKSRSAVTNSIRLLNLPPLMQDSIRQGRLEEGHGKVLAGIDDERARLRLFRSIIRRGLSVRDASLLADRLAGIGRPAARPGTVPQLDPNTQDLEDRLRRTLSAQVKIKPKGKGGMIEVTYVDWKDLDRISWQMLGGSEGGGVPA
jgi:ParB family chromosome partitioning protein